MAAKTKSDNHWFTWTCRDVLDSRDLLGYHRGEFLFVILLELNKKTALETYLFMYRTHQVQTGRVFTLNAFLGKERRPLYKVAIVLSLANSCQ